MRTLRWIFSEHSVADPGLIVPTVDRPLADSTQSETPVDAHWSGCVRLPLPRDLSASALFGFHYVSLCREPFLIWIKG